MLANVDVQRCLFIIFQHQPIYLPYSALSVEQFIRDFDWVLCKHLWEFPIHEKLIPKLTLPTIQTKNIFNCRLSEDQDISNIDLPENNKTVDKIMDKVYKEYKRQLSHGNAIPHMMLYTSFFLWSLMSKTFFTDFQCVGTENDFVIGFPMSMIDKLRPQFQRNCMYHYLLVLWLGKIKFVLILCNNNHALHKPW